MSPTLSCTSASGGSPASRERMMRSWRMSNALTIEVIRPGAAASPLTSRGSEPPRHHRAIMPLLSRSRLLGRRRGLRAAERVLNGGAAAEAVARNVERDDPLGAERARDADRHRIDDRAVEQPASVDLDRLEHAGQGVGGADRLDQRARAAARSRGRRRSRWRRRRTGPASPRCEARRARPRASRGAARRRSGRCR